MKQVILILTFLALLSPHFLHAQEGMLEPEENSKPKGVTLPDFISKIAELDQIGAGDYFELANGTVQFAMSVLQQQKRMPDPPILDALDAVTEGRKLDPNFGDWNLVEQRLLDLLKNPPPEKQKQDKKDQSKNSESEDGEEGEPDPQQSGEQKSQEDGDSSKENQSEQQDGQSGDQQQNDPQEGEPKESESSDEGQQGQEKSAQKPNTQDGAQMGDLEKEQEQQDIQLDGQAQAQPAEQMQKIGGQTGTGEPVDTEKAALMQMLDQLKQQDEPGKLYKILQEAQSGKKQKSQPNAKDW